MAFLDGLRVFAAVAVLARHWVGVGAAAVTKDGEWVYAWPGEATEELFDPLYELAVYGGLGVNLFFLISGFVICLSGWGRSLGEFFTARVARLFPAYWFAILLTVIVVTVWPTLTGGEVRGGLGNALLNLTMVQSAYHGPSVDPSYWTLWYELLFYLNFAALLAFGLSYRRVILFCGLWTIGAMAASAASNDLLTLILMPNYAPYFMSGVLFYLIYRYGQNLLLWGLLGFQYLIALHFATRDKVSPITGSANDRETKVVVTILITCCFLVMVLVARRTFDGLQWRWLATAGALSYPLYLLHQVIGFVMIREMRPHLSPVVTLSVAFVGMVTLAWLVQRFIETPGRRWLRIQLNASFATVRQQAEDPPVRVRRNSFSDDPSRSSPPQPIPSWVYTRGR